jgi:4-diphosphocytidyl-2C-methyl-D-erythritol kinase
MHSRVFGEVCLTAQPWEIVVRCERPDVPNAARNLVHRAAGMLQPLAPGQGVQVVLQKTSPVAAGLGGGSSDAAATLLGLNILWRLGLSLAELAPYAARLGADVPLFLLPAVAAMGYGRGDELGTRGVPQDLLSGTRQAPASGVHGLGLSAAQI